MVETLQLLQGVYIQGWSMVKTRELLQEVYIQGWSMVEGRDAIYKEFLFKDFNEAWGFMSR